MKCFMNGLMRQEALQEAFPTIDEQKEEIKGMLDEMELRVSFLKDMISDIRRMLKLKSKKKDREQK